ncbi:MAG: glucose-6-phosphate isomerase [Burkholderiales bacterium]
MSASAVNAAPLAPRAAAGQPPDWALACTRGDHTPAWAALRAHYQASASRFDLRNAFAQDPQRFERLSLHAPHVFADLSKSLLDDAAQALLLELARQSGLQAHRDALFAGAQVNRSEQRAVMHFLLRQPKAAGAVPVPLQAELAQVHAALDAMLAYAQTVRDDSAITDVVHIGIGGSDLGPLMAVQALHEFAMPSKRLHFVSNVDGHELAAVLARVKPAHTLFLIASKTFTTVETMTNARSALAWFAAQGGSAVARHFCALTSNVAAAQAMGISTTFGFWDWVGGRYSLWSAIGLPLAIAIGPAGFRQFLAGAHEMDQHFCTAPLERNLPVRLGLLDVWYRNFCGFASRNIAPYHSALRRLAAYLQQLEMESNGKRYDAQGQVLPFATAPVLWGEPGTNGQHAYFQMLHQGSDVVPVEFVAVKNASAAPQGFRLQQHAEHHQRLLANALAQAQALMLGKRAGVGANALDGAHFPGNRPSIFLLLDALTPASLGAFLALQEHRVFTSGSIWGINSFDQSGVELGKQLANDIEARMDSGNTAGLDSSTAGLLRQLGYGAAGGAAP